MPAPERIGNPAAREHPRKDLRARRVEVGVDALDERRAAGVGEQVRQARAQPVDDTDRGRRCERPCGRAARSCCCARRRSEDLVVAPVVRRVDDALSCQRLHGCVPVAPSRTSKRPASSRSWRRRSAIAAAASANVSHLPVRISISDAISSPTRCSASGVPRRPPAAPRSGSRARARTDRGSRTPPRPPP